MVERGQGGRIVNIASTSVRMTMPGISAYATSKGGVKTMTNAMALSMAPHGIGKRRWAWHYIDRP